MNTSSHSPRIILAAICLAALVLPMSFTGGAVATPFIGQAFRASPTELAWITNAFMLSFSSVLMAAGTLADLYGRTSAVSLLGTTFGVGLAFGPVLSGLLIEALGWHGIFLFTALLAIISLAFALPNLRESHNPHTQHLDTAGGMTFSGLLIAFTIPVILAPDHGWNAPLIQALLAVSVGCLAAFAWVETRASQPMLELRLFRFPRFAGVQILPIGT